MPSEKKDQDLSVSTTTRFKTDDSAKIKVLCVDDNAFRLYITGILLEHEDDRLVIKTTASTADALFRLSSEAFDAVVCDFRMPEMNGLEFLEQLRSTGNMIPCIILTAHNGEGIATRAMNLGVNHFINKRNNLKSLFSILAWAISSEVEHNRGAVALNPRKNHF
ncbi:MAG: response regulator transcription factor [Candidatus Hodarchaeales archaeon]